MIEHITAKNEYLMHQMKSILQHILLHLSATHQRRIVLVHGGNTSTVIPTILQDGKPFYQVITGITCKSSEIVYLLQKWKLETWYIYPTGGANLYTSYAQVKVYAISEQLLDSPLAPTTPAIPQHFALVCSFIAAVAASAPPAAARRPKLEENLLESLP